MANNDELSADINAQQDGGIKVTTPLSPELSIVLLHDGMVDKEGKLVTTSITSIDVHDIARSATTYGAKQVYIAHPSASMRRLAHTLKGFWEEGFGATYNPNRKEALQNVTIASDLDEVIQLMDAQYGELPTLVATSAKNGENRLSCPTFRKRLESGKPHLLMFGTGWGMSPPLMARAQVILAPLQGPTPYNHLSVRSACAIYLDRLFSI